jgi:hypothetical protein
MKPGLSARSAADQLRHAKPSLTADIYIGRRARDRAVEVLERPFEPNWLSSRFAVSRIARD